MNEFIRYGSLRRRPARKAPIPKGQPVKDAEHTTMCAACKELIVAGRDRIVFDYTRRAWVHDNGKCRTNDTART